MRGLVAGVFLLGFLALAAVAFVADISPAASPPGNVIQAATVTIDGRSYDCFHLYGGGGVSCHRIR